MDQVNKGAQGHVHKCEWTDGTRAVMKMSKFVDFVVELEEEVWRRTSALNSVHFCPVLEKLPTAGGAKEFCLFFKEVYHEINGEVVVDSLSNLIYESKYPSKTLYNSVLQTLGAITLLESIGITHYDLHSDNVMMTNALHDVNVYQHDDNFLAVETCGVSPVLIDFGLAFVPGGRYNATSTFADTGFTTYTSDPLADARLLLSSTVKDFENKQGNIAEIGHLIVQTKRMFAPMGATKHGWLKETPELNVMKLVCDMEPKTLYKRKGGLFADTNFKWLVELLQHTITTPLDSVDNNHLRKPAPSFEKCALLLAYEWLAVEDTIRNTREEQLFFKEIVMFDFTGPINNLTVKPLKNRFPKIGNLLRILKATHDMSRAYFCILEQVLKTTLSKRDEILAKTSVKNTWDVIKKLKALPIYWKDGMTVHFMQSNKTITIDGATADNLNNSASLHAFYKSI
jgi:tRNA A-37 threonylcarbamoyl transferase component Bud32